jgi:hypothetical protein
MNISESDILIFVEDPGAANFVAGLPSALVKNNISCSLFASGLAKDFLNRRNIKYISIDGTYNAESLISYVKPKLILIGTSTNKETFGNSLIDTSRNKKIISIGMIDAAMGVNLRFAGDTDNPIQYAPNLLMVPTDTIKKSYVGLGYKPEKVIVTGNPQYDYVIAYAKEIKSKRAEIRNKLFPKVPIDKKILVFVSEGSAKSMRYSAEQIAGFSLKGWGDAVGRTEIVIEELLSAFDNNLSRPYMVLRPHPKDRTEDFSQYLNEFDYISKEDNYIELLSVVNLVVGMTSMMMLEAALIGRPTLSILPFEEEKNWLPTISNGTTCLATSGKQVKEKLKIMLDSMEDKTLFVVDGPSFIKVGAVNNIVRCISNILDNPTL